MMLAQKVVTDVQTFMPVMFHELFQNPSCMNCVEVNSVMDFIDRTLTNLQLVYHFLKSHPSVTEN